MDQFKEINEEKELFVEIIYYISCHLWNSSSNFTVAHPPIIDGSTVRIRDYWCDIMIDLLILEKVKFHYVPNFRIKHPGDIDNLLHYENGHYKFKIHLHEVVEHLQTANLDANCSFTKVIGRFLNEASFRLEISTQKAPFHLAGRLQKAMRCFVNLGYATREPDGFQWTEKIAPIMIDERLWTENRESIQEIKKDIETDLAEKMWNNLPRWHRYFLANWWKPGKSELDLFLYLFKRWDGNRYTLFERKLGKPSDMLPDGHVYATKEIAKRLSRIRRSK